MESKSSTVNVKSDESQSVADSDVINVKIIEDFDDSCSHSVGSEFKSGSDVEAGEDDVRCTCCKRCVHDNCHEAMECGSCLVQCTCELHHWCRRIEFRSLLRETFTLENAKNKLPITKWLPKYR
jgi:hypothetical protein